MTTSTVRYIARVMHSPKVTAEMIRAEEWAIVREQVAKKVFAKTRNRCFYCGCELGYKGQVEHFLPVSKGGSDKVDNLFPSCRPCNSSKGTFTLEEWRMSRRMKIGRECMDVPVFSRAAVEWLASRDLDVLQGVPDVVFWFEDQGYETPEGSYANGSPAWLREAALERLERARQIRLTEIVSEEAERQGVSEEEVYRQVAAVPAEFRRLSEARAG